VMITWTECEANYSTESRIRLALLTNVSVYSELGRRGRKLQFYLYLPAVVENAMCVVRLHPPSSA
jgi:hypothetical protein